MPRSHGVPRPPPLLCTLFQSSLLEPSCTWRRISRRATGSLYLTSGPRPPSSRGHTAYLDRVPTESYTHPPLFQGH